MGNLRVGTFVDQVRHELDDHLDAINQQQDDIDQNYSYLLDLTNKVKLLDEKLERMEQLLGKIAGVAPKEVQKVSLTAREEDLFRVLYKADRGLTVDDLAYTLRKSESYVRHYLNELINKGVPVAKHVINRKAYYVLDSEFKELQTRHNVCNLEHATTLDAFDQRVI